MDWMHMIMPIAGVPIFWPGPVTLAFAIAIEEIVLV